MQCERCNAPIAPGEERTHQGRQICEDCYMDVLSPTRTCDPWAIHSAKTFEQHAKQSPQLTATQKRILAILKETGGIEKAGLLERLDGDLTMTELEREFAALRHMEKARGANRDGRVVLCLW